MRTVEPGLTRMPSGRFFGWVIGGGLPSAIAADWLTSVWDQNTGSADGTPAAAAIDHVVLRWLADLLELPAASGALVTGAQMASFVGLAVARTKLLRAAGWDIERDGLCGSPPIEVFVGAERHGTIDRALRMLGFSSDLPMVGYVVSERWAKANAAALGGFLRASRRAKAVLAISDEEWVRLAPLTGAASEAELARLRDAFRAGIPRRWGAAEREEAARLYALLAALGGEALVGPVEALAQGTFLDVPAH